MGWKRCREASRSKRRRNKSARDTERVEEEKKWEKNEFCEGKACEEELLCALRPHGCRPCGAMCGQRRRHIERRRERKNKKKTRAREKKTYIVNGISKWEQEKVEHCKATLKNCFFFLETFSRQVLRIEEKFQAECSTLYQTKINEINDINEIKSSKDKRHDTAASQTTTAKVSKSASKSPRCNQRQDKDNYTCAGYGGGA